MDDILGLPSGEAVKIVASSGQTVMSGGMGKRASLDP